MKRLISAALLLPLWLWGETLSLYEVPKMHCPLCTVAVKKSIMNLEGVHKAEVRLNSKEARVWHDDALSDKAISGAISKTGYEGILISRKELDTP